MCLRRLKGQSVGGLSLVGFRWWGFVGTDHELEQRVVVVVAAGLDAEDDGVVHDRGGGWWGLGWWDFGL